MARTALRVENVVAEFADFRQTRHGEQEIASPAEINFDFGKLREGFEHLRTDDRFNVGRVACAVDDAAPVDHAAVAGQAEIVEQEVGVFNAMVGRNQLFGQVAQGFGGDHLSTARHRHAGQFRLQIFDIGIAGNDDEFGVDLALCGFDDGGVAAHDLGDRAVFINGAAVLLDGEGFTQGQVERMKVAAALINQQGVIAVGVDDFFHF